MAIRWFDTHVHLERYEPADQARLVEGARAAGVEAMLAVSVSISSSERTLSLPRQVHRAVGVHPTRAAEHDHGRLGELARSEGVVAIGEAGFDGSGPSWALQRSAFEGQCAIARELGLPLVLHVDGPGAWEQLAADGGLIDGLVVIRHYFSGEEGQARWHAERGHYLSFGRPLIREPEHQRVARLIPRDRLLIETDSYPLPGRTTEPRSLPEVGHALAAALDLEPEACAAQLWMNTLRALNLRSEPVRNP